MTASYAEAREARDEGMDRAERGTDAEWAEKAYRVLDCLVREQKDHVTADDLWDAGLARPREPRALGPVFRRAVRNRLIEHSGRYAQSRHRHLAPIPVWRSLVRGM